MVGEIQYAKAIDDEESTWQGSYGYRLGGAPARLLRTHEPAPIARRRAAAGRARASVRLVGTERLSCVPLPACRRPACLSQLLISFHITGTGTSRNSIITHL